MEQNHGKITKFSVTPSGDIWVEVDEDLFNEIRYNEWESVLLFPDSESLTKLLPNWHPGCEEDADYDNYYDEESDPYSFDWLRRVVVRCLENTRPLKTQHHIYLFIVSMEFVYIGGFYEKGKEMKHRIEIGDEGWENYYYIKINTSPRRNPFPWDIDY